MALDLDCPSCQADSSQVSLVERMSGTQKKLRCAECGHEWLRGEPARQSVSRPTLADIRKRFPKPGDVDPVKLERANELKAEFLEQAPEPDPTMAAYWAKYQQVFSAEGLPRARPQDLKDFANNGTGGNPGNMSVFNDAWNEIGAEAGAERVRGAVDFLLRGTSPADLEDRLTALINETVHVGMKGFKESLLTKVLCIVYPDQYLTILKYTGVAGKREIARSIWGLELPDPERVTWTIGRLVLWSNDLLLALLGDGFRNQQHASSFLWWAKDKA
ncbi:zinc ribbon domain-containing protein [Sinomonas soli]